jgi:histone deacetylase 1/2
MFSSRARVRAIQVRVQLTAAKKKGTSAADYFRQMKTLADTLAAIGQPLRDDEIIAYILAGLGPDFDSLVTTLTIKNDDLTLDEVYAHLLAYEHRHDLHDSEYGLDGGASANFTRHGGGNGGGQNQAGGGGGSGQNQSGGRGNGGGRGHGQGRNDGGGRGQGQGRSNGNTGGGGNFRGNDVPRPICQICNKVGHTALRCYNLFDHSYTGEEHSANTASTSYNIDPGWYTNSSATDHMTSDLDRLNFLERYNGNEQVHVGNGAGLQISHIGHSSINTVANPLILRDVLRVPHITKNLLSMHKLTRDNNVFIEYHPTYFVVKDRV